MGVDPVSLGLMGVSAVGGLMGGGGSQSVSQKPMMTEEQKQMMKLLSGVAQNGTYNGMTFGDKYGGSLGNFNMTGAEQTGQNQLMQLMNSGISNNGLMNAGQNTMTDFLSTDKYNPMNNQGVYGAYQKQAAAQLKESQDALNRSLGSSGAMFSTARIGENRKLAENSQIGLQSKLADLYQNYVNQKGNMASTAYGLGQNQQNQAENIAQNRIAASQQYGGLSRNLANAGDTAQYNEWIRARTEKQQPLQYAGTVLGTNANFQPTSYPTQSPWQGLFNTMGDMGGQMMMKNYDKTGSLFKTGF